MLAHSFDRFYMVTKFILPSIGDLKFSTLNYENTCAYLDNKNICNTDSKKHMLNLMTFCKKIELFVLYYKGLIKSYNNMTHNILGNEINLILLQIPRTQKCGIITTLLSSFIELSYEGISSFLHHKQNKALHKALRSMDSKTTIQHKKLMQLKNSVLMYDIYNAETLEKLINTVHHIHNTASSHEKLFAGQQSSLTLRSLYANSLGLHHYSLFCCYVRQCLLVLKIVLYFFKCLGFCMHFISLYGALSLHNSSSSGLLVFAHLGGIN